MRLAFLILLLASVAHSQQQSINSIEQRSGNCSVNTAGVQGNVTVHLQCPRLNSNVLKSLEKKLGELVNQGALKESRLQEEADDWKNRFLELSERLASSDIGVALSLKAKELLEQGEFDKAQELLEKATTEDEKNIDRAAEDYSRLGQLACLKFEPLKALEYQGKAYRYRPNVFAYAIDYQVLLDREHRYGEAEKVGLQVLAQVDSLHPTDPKHLRMRRLILNNLGTLYKNTSRLDEAEKELSEAVNLDVGGSDETTDDKILKANALSNLGNVHCLMGKFQSAAAEFSRSIEQFELLNKENANALELGMSNVLTNFGMLLITMGNYSGARQPLSRALTIQRSHGVGNGHGSPMTLGNLAIVYEELCDDDAAETYAKDVTSLFSEWATQEPEAADPERAISYNNLGALYLDTGRPQQAEEAFSEARQIYKRLAQTDVPNYAWKVAKAAGAMAEGKLEEQKYSEAESTLHEALEGWRQAEDEWARNGRKPAIADSTLAIARINAEMGEIYAATNRAEAAERAYVEALNTYSRSTGDAAGLADSAFGLAKLYSSTNRLEQAAPLYFEAALVYGAIAPFVCHSRYWRKLADSASGLASASLELRNIPAARAAALNSLRAYQRLHSLDPLFTAEGYATAALTQLDILKKAGSDTSVICPLANEVAQSLTPTLNKKALEFVSSTCH